ncbi:MAG TPA: SDR family oxidoreductase [Rhizomicrobium sp.]|nr:SDR family oxidoreductase [Rhizomicrobium sp.]
MMLEGKTALITGGSSGIGLATAKLFQEHGAKVAVTGTNAAKLDKAKAALAGKAVTIKADVRVLADLTRMAEEAKAAFGKLNIFFANAGAALGTPLGATDEAAYTKLMDVNVKGVFFSVQAVVPLMPEGSSIILNTSWLDQRGVPGRGILSASKAAVRSFTRTFAAELADRKIRVNAVSPGSIITPLHKGARSDAEFAAYVEATSKIIPAGRMGTAEDIANAALFLASDASSYMLGAEIIVDGGRAEL